jgi:hypothetical protein
MSAEPAIAIATAAKITTSLALTPGSKLANRRANQNAISRPIAITIRVNRLVPHEIPSFFGDADDNHPRLGLRPHADAVAKKCNLLSCGAQSLTMNNSQYHTPN